MVEVEVLDEIDLVVAAALPPRKVGELPEREQVVRLHQGQPVLEVEALAGLHLLVDRSERAEPVENRHLTPYLSLLTTACVRDSSSSRCSSPLRHALARVA